MILIQWFVLVILKAEKILVKVMAEVHLFVMVNYKVSPAGDMDAPKGTILVYIPKSANSSIGSNWRWLRFKYCSINRFFIFIQPFVSFHQSLRVSDSDNFLFWFSLVSLIWFLVIRFLKTVQRFRSFEFMMIKNIVTETMLTVKILTWK